MNDDELLGYFKKGTLTEEEFLEQYPITVEEVFNIDEEVEKGRS